MKAVWLLLVGCWIGISASSVVRQATGKKKTMQNVFKFSELETRRSASRKPWLPFLSVESMDCGIYSLPAGSQDGQQPHAQDEVYYVQAGEAKINIDGQDIQLSPGNIVFVPAQVAHHFHDIRRDLKTLVFFSKTPASRTG